MRNWCYGSCQFVKEHPNKGKKIDLVVLLHFTLFECKNKLNKCKFFCASFGYASSGPKLYEHVIFIHRQKCILLQKK